MVNKTYFKSIFLIGSLALANFLNFVFNAYLGRVLSFEEFGFVTLINTIWFIIGNFYNGLYLTISHRTAFLNAKNRSEEALSFFTFSKSQSIKISILVTIIWLLSSSYLSSFFRINSPIPLFLISPIFIFGIIYSVNKGYLHGNINFWEVGLLLLFEAISKLAFVFIFLSANLRELVYLTIPISVFLIYLSSFILINRIIKKVLTIRLESSFPSKFLFASILISLSGTLFLSWDLIMVKHYLDSHEAGMYAILNLVGKIVFFLATLPGAFIIPLVGRNEGKGLDSKSIFNWSISLTLFFSLVSYLLLGSYGKVLVPFLLGDKAILITAYLNNYVISFVFFSLSYTLTLFHLAKKHYIFALNAIFAPILFTFGIVFYHENITQIVQVIFIISVINVVIALILHIIYRSGRFFLINLIELLNLFYPIPKIPLKSKKTKRILLFNLF